MGEKEKQSGSCSVEKSGTEDETVVRNQLTRVTYAAPTWGHVMSGPVLPLRAMSGSVALPKLGSVLMSVTHITTGGHGIAGPGGLGTRELVLPLASCLNTGQLLSLQHTHTGPSSVGIGQLAPALGEPCSPLITGHCNGQAGPTPYHACGRTGQMVWVQERWP